MMNQANQNNRFFKAAAPIDSKRIQKQIQDIKNQMEFIEILVQFWPLPNMVQKMERLEDQLQQLEAQLNPVNPFTTFLKIA